MTKMVYVRNKRSTSVLRDGVQEIQNSVHGQFNTIRLDMKRRRL